MMDPRCHRYEPSLSRRDFLFRSGLGLGGVALESLLRRDAAASLASSASPLVARPGHFLPRAKNVIFLFMEGGPSHMDTFDPKPLLNKLAGQPLPESFGSVITALGDSRSPLLG